LSGRGLCDELITRPEESYRLCCVVVCDLETSRIGAPYIYDISTLRVKNHGEFDGRDTCARGKVENVTTVLSENLKETVHLGELRVDGLVALEWIFKETSCEDAERIQLPQDRDVFWRLVNLCWPGGCTDSCSAGMLRTSTGMCFSQSTS